MPFPPRSDAHVTSAPIFTSVSIFRKHCVFGKPEAKSCRGTSGDVLNGAKASLLTALLSPRVKAPRQSVPWPVWVIPA